jgi:hypothetical protein
MMFKMEGKLVIIKWRENKLVLGFHHPFNLVRGSVLASSGSISIRENQLLCIE